MVDSSLTSRMVSFSLQSDCLADKAASEPIKTIGSFGRKYTVSLADQTCSCPNFKETRADCPRDHLSRWCKHILRVAVEVGAINDSIFWINAIAKADRGGPAAAFLICPPDGQEFLTTIGRSREWINVFVRTARPGERLPHLTGPVREFGWNIAAKSWSYGTAPRGARSIRKLLSQIEAINEE